MPTRIDHHYDRPSHAPHQFAALAGALVALLALLTITTAIGAPPRKPAPTPAVRRAPQTMTGTITGWHDADTPFIKFGNAEPVRVRVWGADSPEVGSNRWPDQPRGKEATEWAAERWRGQVTLEQHGSSFERPVYRITQGDRDLALELFAAGYAWLDTRFAKRPAYVKAVEEAKAAKRGIWADAKPTEPWKWRQGVGWK